MNERLQRLRSRLFCGFFAILIGICVFYGFPPQVVAEQAESQDTEKQVTEEKVTEKQVTEEKGAEKKLSKKLIKDGITAYQEGMYDEAIGLLTQARSFAPSHSPTVLYLGLAYLKQGKNAEAIAAWQEYTKLEPSTKAEENAELPQTIPQYLTLLLREENRRIAREILAREQKIGPGDPQTVAITYYRNLGSPELGSLQKGLTALLIRDITQVKELKVVERDLLQALLEEMQLGTTGAVDEKIAPKVGRLLGAGKVATGSYLDTSKEELRVDSLVAESTSAQVIDTQESSGKVDEFYELEKGLALAILEDLGYDEKRLRAAGVWDTIRKPQTTSMAALTAFSLGLEAKDKGDYATARTQFEQALKADPKFEMAQGELGALPATTLTVAGIVAAVSATAPTAAAATAGVAGIGLGIGTTALAVGAGAAAVGGGIAGGVAASSGGGGGDGNKESGPRCGDNARQGTEQCDGPDLGGQLCPAGGQIACNADCTLDTSDCFTCGNNQREGTEACDGSDLAGQSCASLGLEGGTLACFPSGSSQECRFDTTNCAEQSLCGNGVVEPGEACDDGNTDNTDACLDTCVAATCGDGFVHTGAEQCDDGNSDNTDVCLNTCEVATCGDGFVCSDSSCTSGPGGGGDGGGGGPEACDDGNTDNNDACPNNCAPISCGDGIQQPGEECDDGNDSNADACLTTCVAATCGDAFVCSAPSCTSGPTGGVEECDDNNTDNTDECLDTCAAASCGDGIIQNSPPGEEECENEGNCLDPLLPACATPGSSNECQCIASGSSFCGNGVVEGTEECDDANGNNGDTCLDTCVSATCGDGFVHTGVEQCDDGNTNNNDLCPNTCANAVCGDGIVCSAPSCNTGSDFLPEECDDANSNNNDPCLNDCRIAICSEGILCSDPACTSGPGGGIEECDDLNNNNQDPCLNNCANAICGDGVLCDDPTCTTGPAGGPEECENPDGLSCGSNCGQLA